MFFSYFTYLRGFLYFLNISSFDLRMLRWVQMNKSKLFGGRLETYVKPWGHLNKQMESFRYQNSLCDTVDVWDGGCAPIFCLLVTTRHADGRTPTDILHSTHPHRHFSKHAKNLLQFPHFVVLKLLWFLSFMQIYVDHWGYISFLNFVNWFR